LPGVEKLVTTRFPLDRVNEAFEALLAGKDKDGNMIMKLMVGDY
jgi:L-iditol 2-dehydrogenase